MTHRPPTALIAEDEPLLAQALQAELALAWPELNVVAVVGDGVSAVVKTLAHKPDVLFFDIQMPGLTGLEAAAELADAWQGDGFPALVFVTAYDQFAVQAFEAQAVDYVLKPVQAVRLQKTVAKLKQGLAGGNNLEASLAQLRHLLQTPAPTAAPTAAPLHTIQASTAHGNVIRMIPITEIMYFEAADKYIRVMALQTGELKEYLIRTPLKDLLTQLDASVFWQIHRSIVVRSTAIESVSRDEAGKLSVHLTGKFGTLPVSRIYGHLFKAM
jgi:DNA-binding LytR/AlgR family response regulator